jgi:hypothetical protein
MVETLAKEQKFFHITVFIDGPSKTYSGFNPRLLTAISCAANAMHWLFQHA